MKIGPLGTILKLGEQEQEAGLEIISPQTLRLTAAEAEASYVKPFFKLGLMVIEIVMGSACQASLWIFEMSTYNQIYYDVHLFYQQTLCMNYQ